MAFSDNVDARGIAEVLHFTTSNGLVGILATGKLLAHSELPAEKQLSHILQINCKDRSRDSDWHAFINLSISRINGSFFAISQGWHETDDIFWCILSFSAEIICHDNVLFATTNNAYPMTKRAPGEVGFEALFAPSIRQFQTKCAYSAETGHPLRGKLDRCSNANWTPVPRQTGHFGRGDAGVRLGFTPDGPSLSIGPAFSALNLLSN